MVAVTLMGRTFEVAPYKLGALRKAAPIIERLDKLSQGPSIGVTEAFEGLAALVEFIAIGITKADPTVTAEALEEEIGADDVPALLVAVKALMAASGLGDVPGEA